MPEPRTPDGALEAPDPRGRAFGSGGQSEMPGPRVVPGRTGARPLTKLKDPSGWAASGPGLDLCRPLGEPGRLGVRVALLGLLEEPDKRPVGNEEQPAYLDESGVLSLPRNLSLR